MGSVGLGKGLEEQPLRRGTDAFGWWDGHAATLLVKTK